MHMISCDRRVNGHARLITPAIHPLCAYCPILSVQHANADEMLTARMWVVAVWDPIGIGPGDVRRD